MGYDVARALAVFGMVFVNFKVVMGAEDQGPCGLRRLLGLLDGRAAATFVVLAGVGISALSRRARAGGEVRAVNSVRHVLLRRALFLFVVGLAYSPIWPADILHFYGVYLALATLLVAASSRVLLGLSGGLVLLFPLLLLVLDYEAGWDWETLHYAGFWTPAGMVRHLFFNGFHPVVPWLAFLLVGLVLGRIDLTSQRLRRRVLGWGMVGLLAGEGGSALARWWIARAALPEGEASDLLALLGSQPMPPGPLYMLAGCGTAVVVIALCVGLAARRGGAGWMRPLVCTGQLALTLYVAHVVLGMGALEAAGRLEHQSLVFTAAAASAFCVLATAFASAWRRRFRRGPLEWVMRKVTGP